MIEKIKVNCKTICTEWSHLHKEKSTRKTLSVLWEVYTDMDMHVKGHGYPIHRVVISQDKVKKKLKLVAHGFYLRCNILKVSKHIIT